MLLSDPGRFMRHLIRRSTYAIIAWLDGVDLSVGPECPTLTDAEHAARLKTRDQILDILRMLIPRDMVGRAKRRIGGGDDGGYVMADLISPAQPILSIGVGPDVSFDLELAAKGHSIVMFDHTVAALPGEHPHFTWHRLGVAATSQPKASLVTLAEMVEMLPHTGAEPILKMDVEGAEWAVLEAVAPETLRRFAQISVEVHFLLQLEKDDFRTQVHTALQKLTADFVIVHVHGNNCGPHGHISGFPMPDVLELTLVRKDLVTTVPSTTWYPTDLDRSNWRGGVDYTLWQFPFMPGSETVQAPSDLAS